jgi:hypothetical protein
LVKEKMMTFQHLVDELMVEEFNPENVNSFMEAIENISLEKAERLQELLTNRDFETLGRFLWNLSFEYSEGNAIEMANHELSIRSRWDER